MIGARARILARIRAANADRPAMDPAAIARAASEAAGDPAPRRPALGAATPYDAFAAMIASPTLTGTIERIATLDAAPEAAARYLASRGLPPRLAWGGDPRLKALDWGAIALRETIEADEPAAIDLADLAIAETGSLVLRSGPHRPTLLAFLPLHHLVCVEERAIVRHLEDWSTRERERPAPRNLNLVTGTSGTADIEAINVRGAHGPRFLHVMVAAS